MTSPHSELTLQEILSLLDVTCLDANATIDDIAALVEKTKRYPVAALCVLPKCLSFIPKESPIRRATVVNFPGGEESFATVETCIEAITKQPIHEIDYVFPYVSYLRGNEALALSSCKKTLMLCKERGLTFKVILETGAFPSTESLYLLSKTLIHMGVDFLKTSTGTTPIGATREAVEALLSAMKETNASCGIKISGGIKTIAAAESYIQLAANAMNKKPNNAWFRIGASKLFDELIHLEQRGIF